jgi:hypothetical protein
MRHSKRVATFTVAPLAVVLALVLVPAGPASAGGPLVCAASGRVETTVGVVGPDGQTYDWALRGFGLCTGDFGGPYTVSLIGGGTSTMLGLCDNLIVRDLNLTTRIHLVSVKTGKERDYDANWFAPITTYPIATPFFIRNTEESFVGAGAVETRLGLKCAPEGAPSAVFEWAQTQS